MAAAEWLARSVPAVIQNSDGITAGTLSRFTASGDIDLFVSHMGIGSMTEAAYKWARWTIRFFISCAIVST